MFLLLLAAAVSLAAPLDDLLDPVIYPPDLVDEGVPSSGEVRTSHGGALVLRHTEVLAEIQAGLARVTLVQQFQNPYDEVLEATYLLPLPDDAAVDRMDLTVGDRLIEGWIMERQAARSAYEEAVADGRKAALLEQQRENLFEQSIAGLCPGENVSITLQYTFQVDLEDGVYQLALPTTVGQRYSPPWMAEEAAEVWTPYSATGQELDVTVVIDEGMPVESLWSDSKTIEVLDESVWGAEVRLDPSDARPDADFHLAWTLAGDQPRAAVVTHRPDPDDDGYLALTLEPQILGDLYNAQARELLFVIDSSCSMQGRPYDTAQATVLEALRTMRTDDTFNLVRFSGAATSLFDRPVRATPDNIARAKTWISRFEGGGTHMDEGIVHSLNLPGDPEALRLVLLLTDGFISGERPMFEVVRDNLGTSRLFALGVGSSVNRYLLEGLAEMGRGDVIYQLPGTPIEESVATFHERISHPGMTDISVDWGGLDVHESYPSRIPDLWAGQPLRVVARYDGGGPTNVTVRGRVGQEWMELTVPVEVPERSLEHEAVAQLWARRKIRDLEWYPGERSAAEVRDEVLDVALSHSLVSTYTSLVAIDDEPCACGTVEGTLQVPHLVPAGVSGEGLGGFGTMGYGSGGAGYGYGHGSVGVAYGSSGLGHAGSAYGQGGGRFGAVSSSPQGALGGLTRGVSGGVVGSLPTSSIGLGSGARPPTGSFSGAADLNSGTIARRSVARPKASVAHTTVLGSMDRSLISDVVKRNSPRLTAAYERELRKDPTLSGKLVVRFTLADDGTVAEIEVVSDTLGSDDLADAIEKIFLHMRFPSPGEGSEMVVTYPLVFHPKR